MSETMSNTVEIRTAERYTVTIDGGLHACCGSLLKQSIPSCQVAIVTDDIVGDLYLQTVKKSLSDAGFKVCSFTLPHGEVSKTIHVLSAILEFLAEHHLTRRDAVLALGGGVVGDIAGFAAGTYMRGLRFIQLPTTLLAAVDSSVGGKTAVNLAAGKNLAGVFKQPCAVICDTDTFATLPKSEFSNGLAEVIKYGILADETLFDLLFDNDIDYASEQVNEIVERCVRIKERYVHEDEFERGARQFLNLGHTIGHAVETCSEYRIPHGYAVSIGMVTIARAAEALDWTEEPCAQSIAHTLEKNGLPIRTDFHARELFDIALSDKKRSGDTITLVVPRKIGDCFLHTLPVEELLLVIAKGLGEEV
ncbi:MAG: 3-dehydroquinate synthase [Actinobacteria bacterium]|nr:3-dehydroquinate synthase [Actinomycetota bacterium]